MRLVLLRKLTVCLFSHSPLNHRWFRRRSSTPSISSNQKKQGCSRTQSGPEENERKRNLNMEPGDFDTIESLHTLELIQMPEKERCKRRGELRLRLQGMIGVARGCGKRVQSSLWDWSFFKATETAVRCSASYGLLTLSNTAS
jgi:hypothetical protein